jgi:flagellar assembly protein FliH
MEHPARWQPPSFARSPSADLPREREAAAREAALRESLAAELAAEASVRRAEAEAEGFAAGERAGREAARAAEAARAEERREAFAALVQRLSGLIDALDGELAGACVKIAEAAVRAVVGRLAVTRPELVRSLVAEALGVLGEDLRGARLRLHPDDAALLGEAPLPDVHVDAAQARGRIVLTAGPQTVEVDVAERLECVLARLHAAAARGPDA